MTAGIAIVDIAALAIITGVAVDGGTANARLLRVNDETCSHATSIVTVAQALYDQNWSSI